MKKTISFVAAVLFLFGFANCMLLMPSGYHPPLGVLYSDSSLNKDISVQTGPGGKKGEACATGILMLIATGDASVKAAAAAGGITTIDSVDYKVSSILGPVYHKVCTVVNGA